MRSLTNTDELARYRSALDAIPCAQLDYGEWVRIGMACKAAGLPCEAWDEWCATDHDRYRPGECAEKWETFDAGGAGNVGAGTLIYEARRYGWDGEAPRAYGWGATAAAPQGTTHPDATHAPTLDLDSLPPAGPGLYADMARGLERGEQLREFLRHVFLPGELVNVVTEHDRQGQPCGWGVTMERDELIAHAAEALGGCDGRTGAWVRINPVCNADELERMQREREAAGKKRRRAYCDEHVTAWRYALIEADPEGADAMTPDELEAEKKRQLHLIYALRLPCAAIIDSGHKSVHAVVIVSASDREQYARRVRFLHDLCKANGLNPDPACKNPSRMARLAGAVRGSSTQRLLDVATGPFTTTNQWGEWLEWLERAPRKAGEAPQDAEADAQGTPGTTHPRGRGTGGITQAELVEFMRTDERLRGHFGTNVLDMGRYVTGPLPWDELGERRRWTDADDEHLWCYAQERMGTRSRRDVAGAFTITCAENRYNPIADTLDQLPAWDGEARADFLLWALFGCEDTAYTRAVSHTFMRGAVLRAYEPGCKFDSVLTLIGAQGCGKSYGTRQLVMGHDELLCESVTDLTDLKLTAEQTAGRWIVELAELEGMTGRRLTAVKQALTLQTITVRLSYARDVSDLPRSCVFVATTNEAEFLADPTGARRFWPIRCAIDAERGGWATADTRQVRAFITQAWAEAVAEYKAARAASADADEFMRLFPTTLDADAERMADEAREAASVEDTRVGVVREWLADKAMREGVTRVTTRQVAEEALGVDMARQRGHRLTTELAFILTNRCPGWVAIGKQRMPGYGVSRAWEYRPQQGADA